MNSPVEKQPIIVKLEKEKFELVEAKTKTFVVIEGKSEVEPGSVIFIDCYEGNRKLGGRLVAQAVEVEVFGVRDGDFNCEWNVVSFRIERR